jgi:hypothetical protein
MGHPPPAQLPHHRRFVRYWQLLGPLTVDSQAITAAGKWQVDFQIHVHLHFYRSNSR